MKKIGLLFILLFFCLAIARSIHAQAPTDAWINEFHYENAGADVGEFVEIVVNQSFADLSNLKISFYNGANGSVNNSRLLSSFDVGTTQDGFTIYSKSITSIQNDLDGIAIDYSGTLISGQFLSYEGTFTATDGPANGLTSTDIGVSESSGTPVGNSLFLTGTGTQYSDFTWISGLATVGILNGSQTLPVELTSFSAVIVNSGIKLNWRTETEVNNYGFEVERTAPFPPPYQGGGVRQLPGVGGWEMIGFVEGYGNSNSPKEYSFIDDNVTSGKYAYRLKQIDNDGTYEYSKTIEIDVDAPLGYELSQNYPNPFNPATTIRYSLPETGKVKLAIYNVLGQEVETLVDEFKEAGVHTINFNASDLNSGVYFYKLEADNFVKIRKMSLIK